MYIEIWVFALSLLAALLVGGLIGHLCRFGIGNLWKCLKSLGVSIRNRLVDYCVCWSSLQQRFMFW